MNKYYSSKFIESVSEVSGSVSQRKNIFVYTHIQTIEQSFFVRNDEYRQIYLMAIHNIYCLINNVCGQLIIGEVIHLVWLCCDFNYACE